jgi:hypothetical protein
MFAGEEMSAAERAFHMGMEAAAGGAGRYVGDRLVRAVAPEVPWLPFGASWAAQWGARKSANDTAFKLSRAIQVRSKRPQDELDGSFLPWPSVP